MVVPASSVLSVQCSFGMTSSGPRSRVESRPLDLKEAMDYPWHAATRMNDFGAGGRGDILVVVAPRAINEVMMVISFKEGRRARPDGLATA